MPPPSTSFQPLHVAARTKKDRAMPRKRTTPLQFRMTDSVAPVSHFSEPRYSGNGNTRFGETVQHCRDADSLVFPQRRLAGDLVRASARVMQGDEPAAVVENGRAGRSGLRIGQILHDAIIERHDLVAHV